MSVSLQHTWKSRYCSFVANQFLRRAFGPFEGTPNAYCSAGLSQTVPLNRAMRSSFGEKKSHSACK